MVYPIAKIIIPAVYNLWLRKVEGIGNIPKDKPFIVAANHASYYDDLLLHFIIIPKINKKVHAFVNSTYWKIPIVKNILDYGECIPVFVKKEVDAKKRNEQSFKTASDYLKKGDIVQIFPEGMRSRDGILNKAYNGVGRLVIKANMPVLPVGIIGSNSVLPKGKNFPRFRRCDVKIGELMFFENKKGDEEILSLKITMQIMKEIAKLIGQEYNY